LSDADLERINDDWEDSIEDDAEDVEEALEDLTQF